METQNNINNGVTPNQQPQPQKEEESKKKNKFVAWWLGLNKWAKVGICAGTAAVLATAITLPIVLSKKDGGEYSAEFKNNRQYKTQSINIKKDYDYKFTCTILSEHPVARFTFYNANGDPGQHKFSVKKFEGAPGNNWKMTDDVAYEGSEITTGTLTITVTAKETASNVIGCFEIIGE